MYAVLPDCPQPQGGITFAHPYSLNIAAYERWKLNSLQSKQGYRESTVILGGYWRPTERSYFTLGISQAIVILENGTVTWNSSAGVNVKIVSFGHFKR